MRIFLQRGTIAKKIQHSEKAFTLAEVLITLGIIGVVAALTLPALIANYETKVTVNKLKKVYSTLAQAFEFSVEEYNTPKYWNITGRDNANSIKVRDKLFYQIKSLHTCDTTATRKNCNMGDVYYTIKGNKDNEASDLSAGSSMTFDGIGMFVLTIKTNGRNRGNTKMLKTCYAMVYVDVNGAKKPNAVGKDTFVFYMTEYGIVPAGTTEETANGFKTGTIGNCYRDGVGCTAWVLQNENLDYLKCTDLDWNGKHKC